MRKLRIFTFAALMAAGAAMALAPQGGAGGTRVVAISINDPIHPVTAEFILGAIAQANEAPAAELLVLEMDTPGGLMDSMRDIIKGIQASNVPVAVFVAPSGSQAASAGAFITIAAHIAAMAPGTNIGSASPVNMGGEMEHTMKKKVTNDAAAYIKSLAQAHGRNAEVAERFVTKAYNITETEALEQRIIDLVSRNLDGLLVKLDGWKVKTAGGERVLSLKDARVERLEMNFRQRILNVMANPQVAYIFMSLGMLGLAAEIYTPGAVLPGVVGAVCLILGLYTMQAIPINFAGVFLIILAVMFFILEFFVPSYGALTLGGLTAFVIGSLMLVKTGGEYARISLWVVAPVGVMAAGFSLFMARSLAKSRGRVSKTAQEELIGSIGVAIEDIAPGAPGTITLFGEIWEANLAEGKIEKGKPVEVVGHSGLTLTVRPR